MLMEMTSAPPVMETRSELSTRDGPIVALMQKFGAIKVLVTADAGEWRCRAWMNGQMIEARDERRSTAAAMVLLQMTQR